MDKKEYVYFSYSKGDRERVDRLSHDLRAHGIECWLDVEEIGPGSNWSKEIVKALKGASALLFVLSRYSVQSTWLRSELDSFKGRGGIVIPIVLDDEGARWASRKFVDVQWVDFRSNYEDGFNLLLAALPDSVRKNRPIEAKPRKSKGYVFLSYAQEDAEFIERLKHFLHNRDYAYWDYEESDRDYHNQMYLEIEGVISEAVATLSIISPAWKQSKWALKEYFFSEEIGRPVFLLKAKEVGPTLAIAGAPYIDFIREPNSGFEKLDRELKRKGL